MKSRNVVLIGLTVALAAAAAVIGFAAAVPQAQAEVKRKRSVAKALAKDGDITGARFELAEAADLDRAAAAILDPSNVLLNPLVAGRGGELVVRDRGWSERNQHGAMLGACNVARAPTLDARRLPCHHRLKAAGTATR